jgi:4-amino-4-deoxy-L-arabinose transferase-like glycosyltransferase
MVRFNPKRQRFVALALVGVHSCLLAWGAYRQSPTYNEVAHLVAGISYWQFGQFDVYRVDPPLTRLVAALPVLAAKPTTDWKSFREHPGARPEFHLGKDFVAANGERSLWLYAIARWACIPFSWLGAWICYRWAQELYGLRGAFLALALWCFEPNILAHAQLVTPDLGATALGLTASYCFWRWLKTPTWAWTLIVGGVLGLAELTKFTWLILFALWPVLWTVWRLSDLQARTERRHWFREAAQLGVAFLLAIYVINLGYAFEGSFQPLNKFQFVSNAFTGTEMADDHRTKQHVSNRFVGSRLGALLVPFPSDYVIGVDLQKKDLENFSQKSYLRGEFRDHGWWYFYLYCLSIKTPIGLWVLLSLGRFTAAFVRPERRPHTVRDTLALLAPGAAVLFLVSSQTAFTIHFRYVLPLLPFLFIWASRSAALPPIHRRFYSLAMEATITWLIASSLWIYPHSLSYFNEVVGGPNNGANHVLDSNIDWGQDLLFLRDWVKDHTEARPINLAYSGYFNPIDVGIEYQFPNALLLGNGIPGKTISLEPAWYAISVNLLRGMKSPMPTADGNWNALSTSAAADFRTLRPIGRAGYSIYLFHVPQ